MLEVLWSENKYFLKPIESWPIANLIARKSKFVF